jgi:hypothetical protein
LTLGVIGLLEPAGGKVLLNRTLSPSLTGAQQSCEK